MSKVPGSVGLPILGDKSLDFYRNPVKFVTKQIEDNKSRVFCARFLNTPTVFIGCNKTIKHLLTGNRSSDYLNYSHIKIRAHDTAVMKVLHVNYSLLTAVTGVQSP